MVAYRSASGGGVVDGTSYSVTKPAGVVAGDFMTAFVYCTGSSVSISLTGGSTWNRLDDLSTTGGGSWRLFWKNAGASEPSSYTVTLPSSGTSTCSMVAAVGGATTTPVFARDVTQPVNNVVDTPGITPEGTSDLEIRFVGGNDEGALDNWTVPGVLTERDDRRLFSGDTFQDISTCAATRTLASGSATTSLAFTNAGTLYDNAGIGVTLAVTEGSTPQTVTLTGIGSGEAFGAAQLNFTVKATAIASGEAFGSLVITTPQPQTISPTGIATGQAFGTLTTKLYLGPSGITTGEAFGAARLAALIGPSGIASGEAFGTTNVAIEQFITPSGMTSGEVFGTLTLQLGYPQDIFPEGIESAEVVEDLLIRNADRLVLLNPSIQETPAAWDPLNIRFGIHRGITILRDEGGTWRLIRYPSQTELEVAQRFYLGGRRHVVSVDEANDLIDAGYGAYIELEPDT